MKRLHLSRPAAAALAGLLLLGLTSTRAGAYAVSEGRRTETLSDGTQVNLILDSDRTEVAAIQRLLGQSGGRRYYYLPTNLRLSKRDDGVPEFLFLKFTTEQRETEGGVSGALMHFLMEYGLTPAQEQELTRKLQTTGDTLIGGMPMKPDGESSTFLITSATLKDETMTKSLVTSGKAPLIPGQKVAAAARLTANGAQLMAATLEKARSIADCSISFNLAYTVVTPAIKGSAIFHASRLQTQKDTLKRTWEHSHQTTGRFLGFLWETSGEDTNTYSELRDQFNFLQEQKVVEVNFVETVNDERASKIRDAVFQNFLDSFFASEKASPEDMMKDTQQAPKPDDGPGVQGDHYRSSIYRKKTDMFKQDKYWYFTYSLPITETMQITGNLASWYNGVRDNPTCVAAVNLNDPFFTHRDINFILDLDAKEMFDEAVNYVTVNVRKKRTSGNPFADAVTIDAKYVKEHGINATVTYARGEDNNSDAYEYQAQWSLKGGNVYPPNPAWMKGSWEGVTLAPPVVPRKIDVEGDLEALKASEITRVTVQLHYLKFGQEVEENIHLSPATNEPLVSKRIFMDRGAKGYAYRLVVNHKTEGKLILPWSAKVGDDYVYASIPEELVAKEDNPLKATAKELGKAMLDSAKEKVLDKFKELLGVGSKNPS